VVTLTEVPAPGSTFDGWSGACAGTMPNTTSTCVVTLASAQSVTATFNLIPPDFTALTPARLLDSRTGSPTVDGLFSGLGMRASGSVTEVVAVGRGGVPADAVAVALNVTVTETAEPGFVTVFPCGSPVPTASSANFTGAQTVANVVIAKVGAGGRVCVYASSATHLVIDVDGWFRPPAGGTAGFGSLTPARLLDSRVGGPTVDGLFSGDGIRPAGSITEVLVTGRGGTPLAVAAVALNVTLTETAGSGFVTVFPCGSAVPTASNVNFTSGRTIANGVIAKVGVGGKVCVYASAATHLVVDVNGWFIVGLGFGSLTPARLLDSRFGDPTVDGLFTGMGLRTSGSITEVVVAGRGGVPANAAAVALNVTVTEASGPGFVTVFPCGSAVPTASSVNFATGQTVANGVIAKVGSGGKVCAYSTGLVQLVIDVAGWFM
jgi:Divergent InlB B-repeat domain